MTSTFIALGIFIIIATLAIYIWRENGQVRKRPSGSGLKLIIDGVEVGTFCKVIHPRPEGFIEPTKIPAVSATFEFKLETEDWQWLYDAFFQDGE